MAVESLSQGQPFVPERAKVAVESKPFDPLPPYPPLAGHQGSSEYNWVLTDYLGYKLAKLLHITDEDMRQKTFH